MEYRVSFITQINKPKREKKKTKQNKTKQKKKKQKTKKKKNDEIDLRKLLIKPGFFLELRRDRQQSICMQRPTLAGIKFHVATKTGRATASY